MCVCVLLLFFGFFSRTLCHHLKKKKISPVITPSAVRHAPVAAHSLHVSGEAGRTGAAGRRKRREWRPWTLLSSPLSPLLSSLLRVLPPWMQTRSRGVAVSWMSREAVRSQTLLAPMGCTTAERAGGAPMLICFIQRWLTSLTKSPLLTVAFSLHCTSCITARSCDLFCFYLCIYLFIIIGMSWLLNSP